MGTKQRLYSVCKPGRSLLMRACVRYSPDYFCVNLQAGESMSLPGSDHGVLAVDPLSETFSEAQSDTPPDLGADAALTARAIVVVTCAGAGLWYVLWKLALKFMEGR